MFESIMNFFKKMMNKDEKSSNSKNTAKERLHLVLVQDRANVSADFLELMKQEIIEVIKKYIEVDENLIDVHLTNHSNEDGTNGAPALYANIPIRNIKETARKLDKPEKEKNIENTDTSIEEDTSHQEKNNEKNIEASSASPEEQEADNEIKQEESTENDQQEDNMENCNNQEKEPENAKNETNKENATKEEQEKIENKTEE